MTREQLIDMAERAFWTFVQAAGTVFVLGMVNVLDAFQSGGLEAAKAAALAVMAGAVAAGFSALKTFINATK